MRMNFEEEYTTIMQVKIIFQLNQNQPVVHDDEFIQNKMWLKTFFRDISTLCGASQHIHMLSENINFYQLDLTDVRFCGILCTTSQSGQSKFNCLFTLYVVTFVQLIFLSTPK